MYKNFLSVCSVKNLRIAALAAVSVLGSFGLGIQTAGDVQPIALIEAGSIARSGDVDGSGEVDLQDVIVILEIAQGYEDVTPEQVLADPNGDGVLTVDDALQLLSELALR